jgi:hypothetical protein
VALLGGEITERNRQMCLADARRAEKDDVLGAFAPRDQCLQAFGRLDGLRDRGDLEEILRAERCNGWNGFEPGPHDYARERRDCAEERTRSRGRGALSWSVRHRRGDAR